MAKVVFIVVCLSFIGSSIASPGLNEIYPCFNHNRFTIAEENVERVLVSFENSLQKKEWQCERRWRVQLFCTRSLENHDNNAVETWTSRAVCRDYGDYSYIAFYIIWNEATGVKQYGDKKISLAPIDDSFDSLLNESQK